MTNTPHVVIIDYGSGNLRSAAKAVEHVAPADAKIEVTSAPDALSQASHIILPGVGAFGDCLTGLKAVPDLLPTLENIVNQQGKPFLGICVGMQLMAQTGLEHGRHEGLGWLDAQVAPIPHTTASLKIPHMGWNTLRVLDDEHPVLQGIESDMHAYFVHSYHMTPLNEETKPDWLLATTDYGAPLTAIVGRDNIIGTQFHPEKSQQTGLRLLQNFLQWRP